MDRTKWVLIGIGALLVFTTHGFGILPLLLLGFLFFGGRRGPRGWGMHRPYAYGWGGCGRGYYHDGGEWRERTEHTSKQPEAEERGYTGKTTRL